MNFIIGLSVFIFGAVIGSFLNVVILRLNTGQSIVFGKSQCFNCAKKLKWYELVPIFSFLALRGRCSSCRSKISWQYPIVEAISGVLFFGIFNSVLVQTGLTNFGFLSIIYFWVIFSILIVIAVYDFHHQIIPELFVWIFNGLAFLGLFFLSAGKEVFFNWNNFIAGGILFSFFAFLWLVSRGRWMGFGDAKLALGIGWLLGMMGGITAITLAFWIGAIVGVALIYLSKNKYGIKSAVAFGPFMILGTAISFFWGEKIIGFLF